MNEQPTHLDLFSGIGGFALAAGWAGFRTVGFCEIEPYCQAVLKKHWPQVPIHSDIRKLRGGGDMGSPALLTGGFPCQPFSVAGKRRGKEDHRHLWQEMLRVIQEARPAWVLGENVVGIINMELDKVCADLEAEGYAVRPIVVPACAVDAPHRRDRVWIMGNSKFNGFSSIKDSGGLFHEPEKQGGQVKKRESSGAGKPSNYVADSKRNAKGSAYRGKKRERECGWQEQNIGQWNEVGGNASDGGWWGFEPELGRVANGIPNRVHRLKGLGNAIVPQVAYQIIKGIKEVMEQSDEN